MQSLPLTCWGRSMPVGPEVFRRKAQVQGVVAV
jgi:hypothetical protein